MNDLSDLKPWLRLFTLWAAGFFLIFLTTGSPWAAPGAVNLSEARLDGTKLTVAGTAASGATVVLYDLNGRRLWSGRKSSFAVTLDRQALANVPCAVRAESAGTESILPVTGAPADCRKAPSCSILSPAPGARFKQGETVVFRATAKAASKSGWPLSYDWDLAGGSMGEAIKGSRPLAYRRPSTLATKVQFVRGDSTYRVRFVATDAEGRRCEDAVDVAVGNPPAGLPKKVKERPAPALGGELQGAAEDVVVMPFEEWSYQNASDMRLLNNGWSSAAPTLNNIRAYAYRKDRLPVPLTSDEVELRYSAASNPSDPVGANSINSTSRNWPLTAALQDAVVQKSDWWEVPNNASGDKASTYNACSWMMGAYWGYWGCDGNSPLGKPQADEGYFKAKRDDQGQIVADDPNTGLGHGAFMPGRDKPFAANAPQAFSHFESSNSWFEANMLPFLDVDDQGRVNPYPLVRVEAVAKGSGAVLASTDGVVSVSRDFHCRECHAKGQVAANPAAGHTAAAQRGSAWGKESTAPVHGDPVEQVLDRPQFFEAASDSLFDQEYAAALNYASLHEFYDGMKFLQRMTKGDVKAAGGHGGSDPNDPDNGKVLYDAPRQCYGCHTTAVANLPFNTPETMYWWESEAADPQNVAYDPNYSLSMHRFHSELRWNADKTDIVRDAKGMYARWDWKANGPNNSTKTGSLFPVFDDQGKQLPMEQSCLRCHAGHREQLYRDRMYTAGVTCYDCHGDMLAVGQAYPKQGQDGLGEDGKRDFNEYRMPWLDEPDCGSCHTGDANDQGNGYFSGGVLKQAFESGDFSATSRVPARQRFAVAQLYQQDITVEWFGDYDVSKHDWDLTNKTMKVRARLFRESKDTHGNVACAACHGAAHSVWPNADPSANDNVTALQLQGHTGTLHECNVCHTADAFRLQGDLDGGTYSGDTKAGILGGPHNLHPVNDPYWFKSAVGDTTNQDGSKYGGWHNNYAKKSGKDGEDQCAACHGKDHKGTRLSKTPVDRVFDFSDMDFAKLQAAGFKSKVVKVPAGTEIGCDTCHSVETSCIGSPAGSQCGVGTTTQASAQ